MDRKILNDLCFKTKLGYSWKKGQHVPAANFSVPEFTKLTMKQCLERIDGKKSKMLDFICRRFQYFKDRVNKESNAILGQQLLKDDMAAFVCYWRQQNKQLAFAEKFGLNASKMITKDQMYKALSQI